MTTDQGSYVFHAIPPFNARKDMRRCMVPGVGMGRAIGHGRCARHRPRRLDVGTVEAAGSRGGQREQRARVEQAPPGLGQRRTLGVVDRGTLEADQIVERRDQLDEQRLPFERNAQLGHAVRVSPLHMLRTQHRRRAERDEQGEERGEAGKNGGGIQAHDLSRDGGHKKVLKRARRGSLAAQHGEAHARTCAHRHAKHR